MSEEKSRLRWLAYIQQYVESTILASIKKKLIARLVFAVTFQDVLIYLYIYLFTYLFIPLARCMYCLDKGNGWIDLLFKTCVLHKPEKKKDVAFVRVAVMFPFCPLADTLFPLGVVYLTGADSTCCYQVHKH